jgi:hypothetical protein
LSHLVTNYISYLFVYNQLPPNLAAY